MEKGLELVKEVKETVVEEMEKEIGTKELVKAFGIGALKGFIGATAITAVTAVSAIALVAAIAKAKKMK